MRQTFEQRFNIKEEKIQIHLDENERHDIIRKTFSREEIGIRKVKKIFYYAFHKCEKCQDKTKVVRKSYVEDQAEFDMTPDPDAETTVKIRSIGVLSIGESSKNSEEFSEKIR